MDIAVASNWIVAVVLLSIRIAIVFFATPFDAFGRIPKRVKLIITIVLSATIAASLKLDSLIIPKTIFQLLIAGVNEVVLGLAFAFAIYCVFASVVVGGRLLDMQAGLGAAGIMNPTNNSLSSMFGDILLLLAVSLVYLTDTYLIILKALALSVKTVPPGIALPNLNIQAFVAQFGFVFSAGITLAAPVVGWLLLADTAIGVMSRSMPQMNVYFLFLPLKVFLSLVLLALSLEFIEPYFEYLFQSLFNFWSAIGVVKVS